LTYYSFDFAETFDKIASEFIDKKKGYSEKVMSLLSCLLIDLLRAVDSSEEKSGSGQIYKKSPIIILDRFFTLQYNCNPSKANLADRLSISERQLERLLHETYGMTFKEKVQKTRFDTANYYLRNLGYSAGAVAALVGFSCESSFYAAYKKYFGVTPSQYLLRMGSDPHRKKRLRRT
jgi:AraC-like DNA-binding protein